MAVCQNFESIRRFWKVRQGTGIKARFHLYEDSREFLIIQPCLLTEASQSPPKCGVRSGMNFHRIRCDVQNPAMARAESSSCWSRLRVSFSAPMKFVPWFLQSVVGIPLRPINLRKVVMKADVVILDTISRGTAFVAKHTNTATYPFVKRGLRIGPHFTMTGPA